VLLFLALVGTAAGFNLTPLKTAASKHTEAVSKASAAATALSISLYSQAASAKSVLGVNGALDFGPLAGDQPGGEGTGKVRTNLGVCCHCESLLISAVFRVLWHAYSVIVLYAIWMLFAGTCRPNV